MTTPGTAWQLPVMIWKITSIALRTPFSNEAAIEVVDPQQIDLGYERIECHRMTAADYVSDRSG